MKHTTIYVTTGAVAAIVLVGLALFLHTFSASPLPKPTPYAGPLPVAAPPKDVTVFSVVTGVNGYRGGLFFDRRDFSMAGALVKHPKGDLLVDTGFGRQFEEQFRTLRPWILREITSYSQWQPAADQIESRRIRPEITARHSSDSWTLGSRQWLARLSRGASLGHTARTRVHPHRWTRAIRQALHRDTIRGVRV